MKTRTLPRSCFAGREAREAGKPKIAPATLNAVQRSWWLCGWNEADMEYAA